MRLPGVPFLPGGGRSGGFGITGSPSAGWAFNKTDETGVAESIVNIGVAGASGSFGIANGTSTDTRFEALVRAVSPDVNSRPALQIRAGVPSARDNGTASILNFNVRNEAGSAITARTLYAWQNNSTDILSLVPLNSGADAGLKFPGSGLGAPTFTSRSIGSKLILRDVISGSQVDYAIGVESGHNWYSVPTANSSFGHKFYAGTTTIMTLRGDGLMTTTGGQVYALRVSLTSPVALQASDYCVVTKLSAPGAVAVTLPTTSAGRVLIIKDGTGDAGANNITITPAAGTIDGAATLVLSTNYGRAVLVYNGTEWNRID